MVRGVLLIVALFVILAAFYPVVVLGEDTSVSPAFSISVTNGSVLVYIRGLKVLHYRSAVIRYGFINSTTFRVIYSASTDDPSTLPVIRVVVIGEKEGNEDTLGNIVFDPTTATTETILMLADINCAGYDSLLIEIYDVSNGVLIDKNIVPIPKTLVSGDLGQYLSLLIPAGVLFAFMMRGSLKDVGIGFLFTGIIYLLLPYIGIEIYNSMFVSAVSISLGLLFLYLSSK